MPSFHMVTNPGGRSCDFCTAQPIEKLYGCRNFTWQKRNVFPGASGGGWAACRECAELVDSERWTSLTERSLRQFLIHHRVAPRDVMILREQFRRIHELFRRHRIPAAQTLALEINAN